MLPSSSFNQKSITGKQIRVHKSGFDTRKEAELAYLELATTHKPAEKGSAKFYQIYDLWMETYALDVKASTLKQVQQIFKDHILPVFGNLKMKDITPPLVQRRPDRKSVV